jgi:hypothetical protein
VIKHPRSLRPWKTKQPGKNRPKEKRVGSAWLTLPLMGLRPLNGRSVNHNKRRGFRWNPLCIVIGGADGDRTHDLLNAILYREIPIISGFLHFSLFSMTCEHLWILHFLSFPHFSEQILYKNYTVVIQERAVLIVNSLTSRLHLGLISADSTERTRLEAQGRVR